MLLDKISVTVIDTQIAKSRKWWGNKVADIVISLTIEASLSHTHTHIA